MVGQKMEKGFSDLLHLSFWYWSQNVSELKELLSLNVFKLYNERFGSRFYRMLMFLSCLVMKGTHRYFFSSELRDSSFLM